MGVSWAVPTDYEWRIFRLMIGPDVPCSTDIDGLSAHDALVNRYFLAYQTLSTAAIRRLWIAEGKRRGYELTDQS